MYICFGLITAFGFTFVGMVPHVFLISEWFSSNRASAIGVVYAGSGVGIMILAPLSAWLISNYGWARALEIYAAVVLISLLPLVWIFISTDRSAKSSAIMDRERSGKSNGRQSSL